MMVFLLLFPLAERHYGVLMGSGMYLHWQRAEVEKSAQWDQQCYNNPVVGLHEEMHLGSHSKTEFSRQYC